MTLLALACPKCATALPDANERHLFVCGTCARTWSPRLDGRGLMEIPRHPIAPTRRPEPGARVVMIPVWSVTIHTELLGGVGPQLPSRVRIPAVGVDRLQTLLQFARNLSRAPIAPEPWEGVDVRAESAEVAAEDALVLAETVVLRHLDHWPSDDQLPTLEIPVGGAHLVDWPCAVRGGEVIELVGGLSVHRSLIDGVELRDQASALDRAFAAIESGSV